MTQHTEWHHLAEPASKEMDSAQLLQLVDEPSLKAERADYEAPRQ